MADFSRFVKQMKGKDISKIPKSYLSLNKNTRYIASVKYDGNYVQIHNGGLCYTSGGKPFRIKELETLTLSNGIFLEAEYVADTLGKLGDRGSCTTTTFRTEYSKGIVSSIGNGRFRVFNLVRDNRHILNYTSSMFPNILVPVVQKELNILEASNWAIELRKQGYEGVMLRLPELVYSEGKRVNDIIKIKKRPTADLLCIGYEKGEGKYIGMIGSLILKDSEGRVVKVGSGMTDSNRDTDPQYYIGKIIEIEYEQILDTYIQPVFLGIRSDKTEGD